MRDKLFTYVCKMKGASECPPRVRSGEIFWSWAGAFIGISLVGLVNEHRLAGTDLLLMIGSFGASAVLIYGAVESPLAQPRNLVGGHVLSAVIGVFCAQLLAPHPWLAASLAVSTAIAAMHVTRTLHPPGGATALIAVIGGPEIRGLGYGYALAPVGLGVVLMLLVALVVNNIPERRRYPVFWL